MDIQIISNEDLYYLKSNLASHKDYYREDNNEWLNEVFEKSPFIPTKYNGIKDVKLKSFRGKTSFNGMVKMQSLCTMH